MDFSHIFGVYSRRYQNSRDAPTPLSKEFRYRVIKLCEGTFDFDVWREVHTNLEYSYGRDISAKTSSDFFSFNEKDDTIEFLAQCSDERFLDFTELVLQYESFCELGIAPSQLVDAINEFFKADDLPYSLIDFVRCRESIDLYPRVIRRDSEVLHETAIEPALNLLANPVFASANREFLAALKDYRNGESGDCVAKCGSSLESVMKVICEQEGWSYQQNDTAATLLDNIFQQIDLGGFFKEPIKLIATIRNRHGSAHGAGAGQREVPEHVAHYAINATASAILLLVEAADTVGTG